MILLNLVNAALFAGAIAAMCLKHKSLDIHAQSDEPITGRQATMLVVNTVIYLVAFFVAISTAGPAITFIKSLF